MVLLTLSQFKFDKKKEKLFMFIESEDREWGLFVEKIKAKKKRVQPMYDTLYVGRLIDETTKDSRLNQAVLMADRMLKAHNFKTVTDRFAIEFRGNTSVSN
jgi:hypothetical protein